MIHGGNIILLSAEVCIYPEGFFRSRYNSNEDCIIVSYFKVLDLMQAKHFILITNSDHFGGFLAHNRSRTLRMFASVRPASILETLHPFQNRIHTIFHDLFLFQTLYPNIDTLFQTSAKKQV